MKSAQKIIAAMAACTMGVGILAACGGGSASSSDGKVYFLNTKPEIVDQLQELASAYTKETGIKVDIETAASGTSNQTLTSELSKTDGPSMFNIAGFDQYAKFKKYLEPVQDSEAYKLLTDEGKATLSKMAMKPIPSHTPQSGMASSTTRRSSGTIAPKAMQ